MIKRISALLAIFAVHFYSSAQQVYFPVEAVSDSAAFIRAMPDLAENILKAYKKGVDEKIFLRNRFALQMVAGRYGDAVNSIHCLRPLYKGGSTKYPEMVSLQYELFCDAKLKEGSDAISFAEAFQQRFRNVYGRLDDKASQYISTAFITRNGVVELWQTLQSSLSSVKTDSISLSDAVNLCRSYNIYRVFNAIEPLAKPVLAEDDAKRYIIEDSVLIRTRDNAYISAIVVRKKGIARPQPCILQFSIYANNAGLSMVKDVVANGYTGIMAFTRGKRYSPNEVMPYEHDGRDAYDVIDWIIKQSWSNGKVGMFGGSYNGFACWAAAKELHPALKTIVPSAAVAPGLDVPMMNNVFMSFTFPWTYYVSNNQFLDEKDYNDTIWNVVNQQWYASGRPYYTLDSILGRSPNKIYRRWLAHPTYDAYWQHMIPYEKEFAKINIPVLSTTGYYDGAQVGAMYYFREHYKYNKKAEHYLLIGPYGHFGCQSVPDAVYNGYAIDPVANISIHDVIFQWFDHILKDSTKPAILQDRINYEVMGGNEWRHTASLNTMSNDTLKFYLSNKQQGNGYDLSGKKPLKSGYVSQKVNFADRNAVNNYDFSGQLIYDSLDVSNGVLFTSEPLQNELSIDGAFSGLIKAAINKKDMDISINLYEQMPDGKYFYLSHFMGRASYAADIHKRQLFEPGKIKNIPFTNTYITGRKMSKGSRIIIVLNVNKSQNEQINYGTGRDVSNESIEDAKEPLQVKWYNSSYINVPVRK